jgi:hypothetical protein|tara:strand:- start:1895 stop:2131 length:237 start_codon:yes stop_codon:yes gene_type:complete
MRRQYSRPLNLKPGDLVRLVQRWDPGPEYMKAKIGIIIKVVKAGPVDPREDSDIATVLWEDKTQTQSWNYEIEVINES